MKMPKRSQFERARLSDPLFPGLDGPGMMQHLRDSGVRAGVEQPVAKYIAHVEATRKAKFDQEGLEYKRFEASDWPGATDEELALASELFETYEISMHMGQVSSEADVTLNTLIEGNRRGLTSGSARRLPSVEEILGQFPTWNDALIAAGLEPLPEEENVRLNEDGEVVPV